MEVVTIADNASLIISQSDLVVIFNVQLVVIQYHIVVYVLIQIHAKLVLMDTFYFSDIVIRIGFDSIF